MLLFRFCAIDNGKLITLYQQDYTKHIEDCNDKIQQLEKSFFVHILIAWLVMVLSGKIRVNHFRLQYNNRKIKRKTKEL